MLFTVERERERHPRAESGWLDGEGEGEGKGKGKGTTVICPPRGGPRDHGRGYPLSVAYPAVDGVQRRLEKKSGRERFSQTLEKWAEREKKSSRYQIRD